MALPVDQVVEKPALTGQWVIRGARAARWPLIAAPGKNVYLSGPFLNTRSGRPRAAKFRPPKSGVCVARPACRRQPGFWPAGQVVAEVGDLLQAKAGPAAEARSCVR